MRLAVRTALKKGDSTRYLYSYFVRSNDFDDNDAENLLQEINKKIQKDDDSVSVHSEFVDPQSCGILVNLDKDASNQIPWDCLYFKAIEMVDYRGGISFRTSDVFCCRVPYSPLFISQKEKDTIKNSIKKMLCSVKKGIKIYDIFEITPREFHQEFQEPTNPSNEI